MLPWQPFLAFYIWGAHWRHLKNTTEPSMFGGDVALCQITLTTCDWLMHFSAKHSIAIVILSLRLPLPPHHLLLHWRVMPIPDWHKTTHYILKTFLYYTHSSAVHRLISSTKRKCFSKPNANNVTWSDDAKGELAVEFYSYQSTRICGPQYR